MKGTANKLMYIVKLLNDWILNAEAKERLFLLFDCAVNFLSPPSSTALACA